MREAVREFTGGDTRLLSRPSTPEQVIRQFFVANRAQFNAQQNMHLDLKAANEFEVTDEKLAEVFEKRKRSPKEYGPLFEGSFKPYIPSKNIAEKFYLKTEEFQRSDPNYKNPFEEAAPIIFKMIEDMAGADLSKPFKFKLSDYGIEEEETTPTKGGSFNPYRSQLPEQPMPNQQVIQPQQQAAITQSGLTPTESALLSPAEQQIRLRQRGLV
jgi:hypothetical protein